MAAPADIVAARRTGIVVPIVVANPVREVAVDGFVASFRRDVKEGVAAQEHLAATRERRVGVEDLAGFVLVEHAAARHFVDHLGAVAVVVGGLAGGDLLGRERHVEVVVEVIAVRRHPFDAPAHALPERLGLRQWRARDHGVWHVVVREVNQRTHGVVEFERAADAAFRPVRAEHEVLDDELAAPVEQVGERLLAVRAVEHVVLLDLDPGQRATFGAQLVAQAGEFLFLAQEFLACGKPFVA